MNRSPFETLFGFPERSPSGVRRGVRVEGDALVSRINGRSYACGRLEIPSLAELRKQVADSKIPRKPSVSHEIVADARSLHADAANAGAVFQVASQFNLLEMCGPNETPEMGVSKYASDPTQGPACALACFAGTVYRNYFVPIKGQAGQTATRQVDCLADLGTALGNDRNRLWEMRNGYALATGDGLREIRHVLARAGEEERDCLRQLPRVGIQWDTEVTLPGGGHRLHQVYASALPVGYSAHPAKDWEPFARLVLEAAYESTLLAAALTPGSAGISHVSRRRGVRQPHGVDRGCHAPRAGADPRSRTRHPHRQLSAPQPGAHSCASRAWIKPEN